MKEIKFKYKDSITITQKDREFINNLKSFFYSEDVETRKLGYRMLVTSSFYLKLHPNTLRSDKCNHSLSYIISGLKGFACDSGYLSRAFYENITLFFSPNAKYFRQFNSTVEITVNN